MGLMMERMICRLTTINTTAIMPKRTFSVTVLTLVESKLLADVAKDEVKDKAKDGGLRDPVRGRVMRRRLDGGLI